MSRDQAPDEYYAKLPGILWEYEKSNCRVVTSSHWSMVYLMGLIPYIGTVYLFLKRKSANTNLRNFCIPASVLSLVFSLVLTGVIGAGGYLGFNWHKAEVESAVEANSKRLQTDFDKELEKYLVVEKEEDEVLEIIEEPEVEEEEVIAAPTMEEAFSYSKETGEFFFNLSGNKITMPASAKEIETAGWEILGEEESGELLLTTFINDTGAALGFCHDKETPVKKAISNDIRITFDVEGISCLGLSNKSTETDVANLFINADAANGDGYNLDTKTGSVVYAYGAVDITVSIKDGLVTGLRIAKVR